MSERRVMYIERKAGSLEGLLRSHPIHVASSWIGNSPEVALKHYLSVTEEDMRAAAADAEIGLAENPGANPGAHLAT